jgi:hypothetical protein
MATDLRLFGTNVKGASIQELCDIKIEIYKMRRIHAAQNT